jgi:hypothetical protein
VEDQDKQTKAQIYERRENGNLVEIELMKFSPLAFKNPNQAVDKAGVYDREKHSISSLTATSVILNTLSVAFLRLRGIGNPFELKVARNLEAAIQSERFGASTVVPLLYVTLRRWPSQGNKWVTSAKFEWVRRPVQINP